MVQVFQDGLAQSAAYSGEFGFDCFGGDIMLRCEGLVGEPFGVSRLQEFPIVIRQGREAGLQGMEQGRILVQCFSDGKIGTVFDQQGDELGGTRLFPEMIQMGITGNQRQPMPKMRFGAERFHRASHFSNC